ncbi:MAG: AraC family transcriptional regulator [Saccharofermentans sp.]|nr:AraC family transcriptional regulator [Saccharofermentans sp.]
MPEALFHSEIVNTNRIIYTPTNFAKESLLHIQEVGSLKANKPHTSKRDNLDSFLFFIVESGDGKLNYEEKEYQLTQGDCVFIDCNTNYYHQTTDNLWALSWIHFNGPTIKSIYNKHISHLNSPVFTPKEFYEYKHIIDNVKSIAISESRIRDIEINSQLSQLLVLIFNESYMQVTQSKKTELALIKDYIDNNYKEKITLDYLSERFFINKFYLTRVFKEQFGTSINNYIINLRINYAKSELRFTDKSINTIANESGIGPLYYFSRVFTKTEGQSPSEYRKKWKT